MGLLSQTVSEYRIYERELPLDNWVFLAMSAFLEGCRMTATGRGVGTVRFRLAE